MLAMVGMVLAISANAQNFEGVITMQMIVPQLGADKVPMVITSKAEKSVMEMTIPNQGTMMMYTNRATQKMVMVMAAMKMGYEIDLKKAEQAAAASNANPSIPKATGQKKTINGFNCELYTMSPKDGSEVEMWLTGDLPKSLSSAVGGAISGMNKMNAGGNSSKAFEEILSKGLVPIEFDAKTAGQVVATIQFVKYEQKPIADSYFVVPSDISVQPMPDRGSMGGH